MNKYKIIPTKFYQCEVVLNQKKNEGGNETIKVFLNIFYFIPEVNNFNQNYTKLL